MSYLERAIADGHAKFSGDSNNDIQPVSQEALIGAIKKCHQTLWAGGKLSPLAAL
jgi:type I restriction enzyme M protein